MKVIALQYYFGFCHTPSWISHRCTYVVLISGICLMISNAEHLSYAYWSSAMSSGKSGIFLLFFNGIYLWVQRWNHLLGNIFLTVSVHVTDCHSWTFIHLTPKRHTEPVMWHNTQMLWCEPRISQEPTMSTHWADVTQHLPSRWGGGSYTQKPEDKP